MKRVLLFDGEKGPQRFDLLRLALLAAGNGKGERTRDVIRKEARLLDALDLVSRAAPTDTDADRRVLELEGGTVTIAQDDFELIAGYVDSTPWNPRASRQACDLQDWLSASDKVDP